MIRLLLLKKKKAKVTPDKVEKAFNALRKKINNLNFELDDIKKFVTEAISIFITDTRYLRDQIMILAERLAELEEMANEYAAKKAQKGQ